MRRAALLALAVVVACGDNLADPGTPRTGSRLKLAWYAYDGGARELETSWYYDAELAQRCVPRVWSDGNRYCSPPADEAVYINDTCTRALGRTSTFGGPTAEPYFATTFQLTRQSVPVPSRLFHRGDSTLAPVSIWMKGTFGCLPIELGDNYDYFELGDEIPLADLVRLHRSSPRGGDELAAIDETSDDGLRAPLALYDRAAESECMPVDRPNAAAIECVPTNAVTAAFYHDPSCSEPVVAAPLGEAPTLAIQYQVATSCWTYYRVGGEAAARPLYELSGPSCVETSPPGGQRFFTMASEQALAALARQRDSSSQRIRSIARVNGQLRLPDPLVYDAELDTECRHDAALQCVPRTMATVTRATERMYFADAQCQTALTLAFVPMGACDPPTRFASDGDDYYPLAEPYTAPVIYVPSTGDTCSGFAPPVPFVAYTVGNPLPRSAFATAKLAIDP